MRSIFARFAVRPTRLTVALLFTAGALAACGPSISKFSETAYEQATSLKVESLALMEAATEPYSEHAEAVRALQGKLKKAHEYAKNRPHNSISAEQWDTLIDPDGNLLGGFLQRWRRNSTLNETFVSEKVKQVRAAFDTIIGLESGKINPEDLRGEQ